jgi:hypothetical protein
MGQTREAINKRRSISCLGGAFLLILILSRPSSAFDILALPGSTWGQLSHDDDNLVGTGAMGYINQGVDWIKLPGEITFNTFAEFRYRLRDKNNDFYNAYGPAVGVEFKKSFFKLGINYYWEQFPSLDERSNKLQFYLSWFYDWDLKQRK